MKLLERFQGVSTGVLLTLLLLAGWMPGRTLAQPLQTADLDIDFVNAYDEVWNDSGSGADDDVSFWRPTTPAGWHRVGHHAKAGYDYPTASTMVVKARTSGILVPPTDYTLIWDDAGSGVAQDGSVWRPVCPGGYQALGDVASGSHAKPSTDEVRCVRETALVKARPGGLIWNDAGSGAYDDFAAWGIEAAAGHSGGLFYGAASHTRPADATVGVLWAVAMKKMTEEQALVAFYHATGGPNWKRNNNWLMGPIASWYGVGVTNGRVTSLNLGGNQLTGSIPPEIGQLTSLTWLQLFTNQLTGSIPPEIGQLTNLQVLQLFENQLSGAIPRELGQLTKLAELNLGNNRLTGSIPHELGRLTNLTELNLRINQLTGSIPHELGQLTNLTELNLSINPLTGSIPATLGQLTRLTELFIGGNQHTGSIPATLGQLTHLVYLDFGENQLSGPIPLELGGMASLKELGLYSNQLTGAIPATLGQLRNLEQLDLKDNQLTGSIPATLGQLTRLTYLVLRDNRLTGSIPAELGRLTNLKGLFLYNNQLTGPIPDGVGRMSGIRTFRLDGNPGLCKPPSAPWSKTSTFGGIDDC